MSDRAELAEAVLAGDRTALARAITVIERRTSGYRELVGTLHREGSDVPVVGITGSPGAGKSTIVAELARHHRNEDETIGVIGIDPSSPVSGGAILGDRIRLGSTMRDPGIFYRSMSTGGALGGLAPAVPDVVTAFEAAGMDRIFIETVGAGQSEIDVVRVADTVAIVLQPGTGDDVQLLKAGILEIGDVFVVNKMDRPDADRTVAQLRESIELDDHDEWTPSIVETTARTGDGIADLVAAIETHQSALATDDRFAQQRRRRYRSDVRRLVRRTLEERLDEAVGDDLAERLARRIQRRELDVHAAATSLADDVIPADRETGNHNQGHASRTR